MTALHSFIRPGAGDRCRRSPINFLQANLCLLGGSGVVQAQPSTVCSRYVHSEESNLSNLYTTQGIFRLQARISGRVVRMKALHCFIKPGDRYCRTRSHMNIDRANLYLQRRYRDVEAQPSTSSSRQLHSKNSTLSNLHITHRQGGPMACISYKPVGTKALHSFNRPGDRNCCRKWLIDFHPANPYLLER